MCRGCGRLYGSMGECILTEMERMPGSRRSTPGRRVNPLRPTSLDSERSTRPRVADLDMKLEPAVLFSFVAV